MRYVWHFLVLVMTAGLAAGCVVTEKIVQQPQASDRQVKIVYPERRMIDPGNLAQDLQLVTAVLIEKMRGDRYAVDGVSFAPGALHQVGEVDFDYGNFDLRLVDILGYEPTQVGEKKAQVSSAGLLHFEDPIGRRASAYFTVRYTVTPAAIVIEESATALVPPAYPRVEAYFVSQSVFRRLEENDLRGFADLYLFTVLNAVPMTATDEEKKDREAYEKLSLWKKMAADTEGGDDYYIIVFCMDRLSSESELKMKISNVRGMAGLDLADPVYLYDQGWRAIIAGGKFKPDSPSTHFFLNVEYTEDPQAQAEPILVGCFRNEKNYSSPGAIQTAAAQPVDPIASGRIFLDPAKHEDAVQIQSRLKQLGYFGGAVDGDFGVRSRSALEEFAAAAGIAGEGVWTLEVQKKLFSEQTALQTGPISSGRQLLNPAEKSDAKLIQTRLKELGYYGGEIDGLFGKGSYSALEQYSLSAGVPGSGRWTPELQKSLFLGSGM